MGRLSASSWWTLQRWTTSRWDLLHETSFRTSCPWGHGSASNSTSRNEINTGGYSPTCISPDGRMLSEVMARQGYALAMVIPPNVRYVESIREAVESARAEGAGLWQLEAFGEVEAEMTVSTPGSECHPSYPAVCIPPPPPDLDCGDIEFRRFRVVGSDPHRFDGDDDGIGCEGE